MGMSFHRLHFVAAACMILASPLAASSPMLAPVELAAVPSARRKKKPALAAMPDRYRRSRGAPAKPRRRPNRMHISKRVRRKHRRAA
jgi:hypothetical protein